MSNENNHQQAQMLRGTAWLTASNFISRLLGAIYIIPWYIWMGTYAAKANGLFTMGYNIYAWFLLISTAGIPVAVAKQVAKYNTMREEEHSFALIRSFLSFMTGLGLVFALVLYLFSPWLADLSGVGKDLIPIMQSLAWAVLIFPSMSVIRGFFQGMNNLKPYAMSQIAEQVIRSGAVDLVIIDSVAALVPKQEIEGDMGETKVGLQARLMSQALRKITGAISKSNTACIFINQLREKIGGNSYGPSETTTGGNALKFYASVRLDIRRIGQLKDGDEVIGNNTRVKVVKNKVAPPFRVANFEILYGQGISRLGEIIDIAESEDFIKKSGSWYSYGATKLGQGKENAKQTLADNPELLDELTEKVKEALRNEGKPKDKRKKKATKDEDEDED